MARLSLSLLGACEATLDGQLLTGYRSQKVRALLVYLAMHAERAHGREALAGLLWPDQRDEAARTYLRQALANLREVLGEETTAPPLLLISRDTVQLAPACPLDLDVTAFRQLLAACARHPHRRAVTCTACARRMEQAVALYGGSFLAGFYLRESTAFEEWAALTREALHQEAVTALARLATYHERRWAYDVVEQLARRQLALDPWREEAHQQLMRALALSGQRSAALEHYERCRTIMQTELGVDPSAETEALYRQIRAEQVMPKLERTRATGLPHPTTSFVGREVEQAALMEQLTTRSCRLITLLGPPGIGKTRLSQEVAAALVDDFEDGVVFVPLAALRDLDLVAPTIAATLQVREVAGESVLQTLTRVLQTRQLLLVLDNFEQVVGAAVEIAHLLRAVPSLTLLVTSRVVLRLHGEQEYPVPALALPDLKHPQSLDTLSQYAAVALFIQRAQAAMPDFEVTNETAPTIAEICVRLDGLPLAIELAAARVKLFSPQALLARLNNRLKLLTGGSRDRTARQQTLRGAIDWSYNLLDADEQTLLAQLGVFVGGWTLEAAEAVCGGVGDIQGDVLAGLASLVDQSLVRQQEGVAGQPRFTMLETIREYALERLAASGGDELMHRRHAAYLLALAQVTEPKLRGPDQGMWLARLEVEHDNLRAVLRWALDCLEIETGLQLAGALFWFWYVRNHYTEGRAWLERLLVLAGSRGAAAAGTRVTALHAAGALAHKQDDYAPAAALLEASLTLARKVGDTPGIAASLYYVGLLAHDQGDYERASALWKEGLRLYRERGDRWGIAASLFNLGRVMQNQGNYEQAAACYDESLMVFQESGDKRGMAFALNQQGLLAQYQGDYERARILSETSLLLFRELGDKWGVAKSLFYLGRVAQRQGDYDQAVVLLDESLALFPKLGDKKNRALSLLALANIAFEHGNYGRTAALGAQSLRLCRDLGYKSGMTEGLEGLAAVAGVQSQPERAARLFGAAMALRETIGATLPLDEHPAYARTLAATRAQLDEATFAAAWAEGQAMTLEQAIAYALEDTGNG